MNNFEDLLSIGEVSEICRISIKTLRYYDKTGIVKPAYVDSTNKYRYYSKAQLPFIGYVRNLRLLGFSLAEILSCFEFEKEEKVFKWKKIVPQIDEKLAKIAKQIEKLQKVQQQFMALKEMHEESGLPDSIQFGEIKVKKIPPRIVAFTRVWEKCTSEIMIGMVFEIHHLIRENNLYFKGPIMSVLHDDRRTFTGEDTDFEVCWEVLAENPFQYPFIREIPGGLYASVLHEGDNITLPTKTYPAIYNWIKEHDYRDVGPVLHTYLVSVYNTQAPDQFVTEVQVPIIKNGG